MRVGSVAFWFLCWGMNYGRHCLLALQADMPPMHGILRWMVEAGYWILPKPVDVGMILDNVLGASDSFSSVAQLQKIQKMGEFHPDLSLATSFLFAVVMIFIAARQLSETDY